MSRLRAEAGFGLIDMLVSMTLMLIVLGASTSVFASFQTRSRANQMQNDAGDRARTGIDRLTRELRNDASPSRSVPQAIDRAGPFDLVAKSVGVRKAAGSTNATNSERVRYCLSTTDPSNGVLWMQTQTWTGTVPPTGLPAATCPDPAWGTVTDRAVADRIVNRAGGQNRAVFLYDQPALTDITQVRVQLFVDVETNKDPAETRLLGGVFLRNQNRAPAASFTATITGRNHVYLNGSASTDPDGDELTYTWYDGTTAVGTGEVIDYDAPSGSRQLSLRVADTAGLENDAAVQTVAIP